jgi:hypothetical protein
MDSAPTIECTFFVPIRRDADLSDGGLHSNDVWVWLADDLYVLAQGGPTVAPGLYGGFYRDPGTGERVADQSRKYIVALSQDRLDELRTLLAVACRVFHQKCIYLSIAGVVEFIQADRRETG